MNLWKCHMSSIGDLNNLNHQNAMRIRVNRVPLMQEINATHIVPELVESKVLTNDDVASIFNNSSKDAQNRMLLQILVNKDKETQWYKHFRRALRSASCDSAMRRRYTMLGGFLDSTILRKEVVQVSTVGTPKENLSFPRFEPLPDIESHGVLGGARPIDEEPAPQSDDLDIIGASKREEQVAPDNFHSVLDKIYEQQVEALKNVPMKTAKHQLHIEERAFVLMQEFEILVSKKRKNLTDPNFCLCLSKPVSELMRQVRLRPLTFKYIRAMETQYLIPVMKELLYSFEEFVESCFDMRDRETRKMVAKTGSLLCELFSGYGNIEDAEQIMEITIKYLCLVDEMASWVPMFFAQVRLMDIRTSNWHLREADQAYHAAKLTAEKIDLMSFGKDLLDKSEYMASVGYMLLLQGSQQPAFDFATKALKILQSGNKIRVARVVHHAILAYHNKWNGKRAEKLAVFFVRFAWVNFGIFSTPYIESLLSLVTVFIRFRPDDPFTVEVAKNAVSYAELLFGCATPLLAQARLLLAQALVAAGQAENSEFLKIAKAAQKDALDTLGNKHPSLAWYNLGLGEALLFKALTTSNAASLPSTLAWAENETRKALEKYMDHFGDISIPTCEARVLLARILDIKGKHEEAVKLLLFVDNVYRLCTNARNHVVLNFSARFARLLRERALSLIETEERSEEEEKELDNANKSALRFAKRVIDNTECYGTYTPWVDECYEIAVNVYRDQHLPTNAAETQKQKEEWLSNNRVVMEAMSWTSLHQQPDAKFLEDWDLWGKHKQSVLSKLTEIRRKAAAGGGGGAGDGAADGAALPEEDMDAVYEDDDFYMFPFDDDIFQ